MNEFADLLPEFIEESRDHLTAMESALVRVESAIREQRLPDNELLDRLFREAHAVYGGAEFVGIEPLEAAAGALADLFNFLRNGDLSLDAEIVALSFRAIDGIRSATEDPSGPMKEPATAAALIRKAIEARLPERVRRAAATTLFPDAPSLGVRFSVSAYALERKTRRGYFYLLSIAPERYAATTGKTIIHLSETLAALGEVLDTVSETGADGVPLTHMLYHTMLAPEALRLSFPDLPVGAVTPISRERLDALVSPVNAGGGNTERRENDGPERRRGRTQAQDAMSDTAPRPDSGHSVDTAPSPEPGAFPEAEWEHCTDFVTFFIDRELYAVPIFLVHDIKKMLPCSRLPNQPPAVLGVINLRGSVVPLFDLRRLLGLPPRPFDRKTVVIILDLGGKMNGLVVDAISDVATIEPQAKQTAPLLGRNIAADYVRFIGTSRKNGEFLIVLDIEKVLAPLLADS